MEDRGYYNLGNKLIEAIKGLGKKTKIDASGFEGTATSIAADAVSMDTSVSAQDAVVSGSSEISAPRRKKVIATKAPLEHLYIFILLAYVGFASADLAILAYRDLMLPQQAPPTKSAPELLSPISMRAEYNTITSRNIFNSDGVIPPPVSGVGGQQNDTPQDATPIPTTLPLTLIGTIVHSNPAKSVATIQHSSKVLPYIPNDDIENLAVMIKAERGKVFIKNNATGRIEYLELKLDNKFKLQKAQGTSVTSPIAGKGNDFTIPKTELQKYMNNLPDLLQQARAIPNTLPGGQVEGFKIVDIMPGSVYEKLGIKPGDIVKGVNGESLSSPSQAMELYNGLKNSSGISLQIERGGKTETLNYKIPE